MVEYVHPGLGKVVHPSVAMWDEELSLRERTSLRRAVVSELSGEEKVVE